MARKQDNGERGFKLWLSTSDTYGCIWQVHAIRNA